MSGAVKAEEIRITPQTLEYQAQIAESICSAAVGQQHAPRRRTDKSSRCAYAGNVQRAAPEPFNKAELLAMADELEKQYGAKVCANFVREAAGVYEARDVLKD